MPNKRRREKKARKRGVPAFHEGGTATHQAQHRAGEALFGDDIPDVFVPPTPPPFPQPGASFDEILNYERAASPDNLADLGQVIGIWEALKVSTGGSFSVGGTSYSVSDMGPVRAALERAAQEMTATRTRLDRDLQKALLAQRELEFDADIALRQQIEERISRIQNTQNMLRQLEMQVNSQLTLKGFDVQMRGQDITQRQQDIDAEQRQFENEIRLWEAQRDEALARSDLRLAQEAQESINRINQAQLELTGRGQDVIQRQQDIDAQIAANQQALQDATSQRDYAISVGDLAARQDAENRIRASEGAAIQLDAQAAQLDAARFGQTGQQGAATTLGTIGRDLGNIELQRDQMLSQLLANPRDAVQAQIALGGGEDIFQQLLGGGPISQSIGNIGTTPLLGDMFLQALQQINQRPELGFFDEAAGFARELGTTQAPATLSPEELYQQYLANLPPVSQLPEAPTPFVPTPVEAPPVAPFVPPAPDPITPGTPDPVMAPASPALVQSIEEIKAQFMADLAVQQEAAARGEFADPSQRLGISELFRRLNQNPEYAAREAGEVLPPLPPSGVAPVPALAGGGDLIVDEPTTAYGDVTGEKKFTLGERTTEFPQGIPERVEITPMTSPKFAFGGTVSAQPTGPGFGPAFGPGFRLRPPIRPVQPTIVGRPMPIPAPRPVQPTIVGSPTPIPRNNPLGGATRPPSGFVPPPIFQPPLVQPTIVGSPTPIAAPLPDQPTMIGPPATMIAAPPPALPTIAAPPVPAPTTPGEILLGIRQALTPRFRKRGLLPSGREFISGRVSALGLSPEDFWADLIRGDPSGINPAMITRANFSTGGRVYSAPRFMVA